MALSSKQQGQLKEYLNQRLNETETEQLHGSDVQSYILSSFGIMYEKTAIYRLLNRLGYSLKARYLHLRV